MERKAHSMKRRCFCHDYYERGIYMITLEVEGRQPILGKLLMLAPWPHHFEKRTITRAQCLALNAMAQEICGPNAACDLPTC